MHYELWDTASRNLLYDFDGEQEALLAVFDLLRVEDAEQEAPLALVRVDNERGVTVATGAALTKLARAAGARRTQRSA